MSGFGERVWFSSSWALSCFQRRLELYVRLAGVRLWALTQLAQVTGHPLHQPTTVTHLPREHEPRPLDRPNAWGSSHYSTLIKRGFLERPNEMTDSKPEQEICSNRPNPIWVYLRRRLSKPVFCRCTLQFQSCLNQIWLFVLARSSVNIRDGHFKQM